MVPISRDLSFGRSLTTQEKPFGREKDHLFHKNGFGEQVALIVHHVGQR